MKSLSMELMHVLFVDLIIYIYINLKSYKGGYPSLQDVKNKLMNINIYEVLKWKN